MIKDFRLTELLIGSILPPRQGEGYREPFLPGGFMKFENLPAATRKENLILKSQLRSAKGKIKTLKRDLRRSQVPELDHTEVELLLNIAECDLEESFEVTFAENLRLSKPSLDFHLTRLVQTGCVDILFVDPTLGENFAITQKGRETLFKRHLL
jgi:hypothetical protein